MLSPPMPKEPSPRGEKWPNWIYEQNKYDPRTKYTDYANRKNSYGYVVYPSSTVTRQ